MEKFLSKLLTLWLPLKRKRKAALRHRVRSWLIARRYKHVKIGKNVRFEMVSHFPNGSEIGDWTKIIQMNAVGVGKIKIGSYCRLSWGIQAVTFNHDYLADEIPFGDARIPREIEIGDFVWIGCNVVLLPGTKIGEGAIIQGGSVVRGTIPPYAIAGGNPARVFMARDPEKFKRQKAEGKINLHTPEWAK